MRSCWWDGDWPITQAYGCTDFELEGASPYHPECAYFHDGLDIGIPCGTVIRCQVAGRIVQVGVYGGGPYALIIDTGDAFIWLFHLQAAYVSVGDRVMPGMPLGEVGTLGFSTGCHLHFEVNSTATDYRSSVDPGQWLQLCGANSTGCPTFGIIPVWGILLLMFIRLIVSDLDAVPWQAPALLLAGIVGYLSYVLWRLRK